MSSRKEQKQALREERLARESAAAAAARRKRLIGYIAGGVLAGAAVAAIVVALVAGGGGGGNGNGGGDFPDGSVPKQRISDLEPAAKAAGCVVQSPRNEGRGHVQGPVTYRSNPPTSGNHDQIPANDGAYMESPPKENLVHTLEHGRILIQFRPSVPDEVKGDLKALFDEDPYHMALAPNQTQMPYEVAATAWGQLLGCPQMNDRVFDAIRAFRDRYRDQGPEFVP